MIITMSTALLPVFFIGVLIGVALGGSLGFIAGYRKGVLNVGAEILKFFEGLPAKEESP